MSDDTATPPGAYAVDDGMPDTDDLDPRQRAAALLAIARAESDLDAGDDAEPLPELGQEALDQMLDDLVMEDDGPDDGDDPDGTADLDDLDDDEVDE